MRFVLSKEAAEDIVSDVFLTFWKNNTYQQITVCYGAYFYQAVRNKAYNYLRQEVNRPQSFDPHTDDDLIDTDKKWQVQDVFRIILTNQSLAAQDKFTYLISTVN